MITKTGVNVSLKWDFTAYASGNIFPPNIT